MTLNKMLGFKKKMKFKIVMDEISKEFMNGISCKKIQPEPLLKYISLTNLM